ncbi:AGE family epimerase/isomerase [Pelagicoccus enzymogenes]|uniref:AGE family epimerase/isomerase n=1 Tax=Pelagicoccus enzymogenes TaxID=2773457 RepID=UPI001CD6938F|nr:AGE family epimerase/isomerase [Pelagicoccus enzymogenes]
MSELEASFQRDLVNAWYPRSVDERHGGYVTGFDNAWQANEETNKYLVGQSRHIWVLSQLALFEGDTGYSAQARHGVRFLIEQMWDHDRGGFYEAVTQAGVPIEREKKSAYGMSFSIYALSAFHAATGDEEALEYARKAFLWLDRFAWDSEAGGYVDDLSLDGDWTRKRIGNGDTLASGSKDYNSSIHILESYTSLYTVWPDEHLRQRLQQMLEIVRDRFVQEPGYLHLIFERDWQPLSFRDKGRDAVLGKLAYDHVSWGHDVETAFLMLEAVEALHGEVDAKTAETAKALVDHALATGWDERLGSLYEGGYYFEESGPLEVVMPNKIWWIAAESLNALLLMSQLYPEEPKYWQAFADQWAYIKEYQIDPVNGGWMSVGLDSDPLAASRAKAYRWKANYHDARAYMNCIRMLRGEFHLTRH